MSSQITIELKKASELTNAKTKTTASGIKNNFDNRTYPLYFHSYQPENSFLAVPPQWLKELAEKAGEEELVEVLTQKIEEMYKEKSNIIQGLRDKYNKRVNIKK